MNPSGSPRPAAGEGPAQPVSWNGNALRLIDQRQLPARLVYLDVRRVDALVDAITSLAVRGAPALGVAGGYGVVLAAAQAEREGWDGARLATAVRAIRDARPTAVNLAVGVDRVAARLPEGREAVLAEAHAVLAEECAAGEAMGRHGADWLLAGARRTRLRVLTHCNAGALATTGPGSALAVIGELQARDALELVYVDETRPLLQGARLTAWELAQAGIPYLVQADGAAAGTIMRGLVDAVVVGADRIAANGDVANKVGTVAAALACAAAGVPFVVAAPSSTIDPATPRGSDIPIEQRDAAEVLAFAGHSIAPSGARAHNPAFDVTPAELVSALVTEAGTRVR